MTSLPNDFQLRVTKMHIDLMHVNKELDFSSISSNEDALTYCERVFSMVSFEAKMAFKEWEKENNSHSHSTKTKNGDGGFAHCSMVIIRKNINSFWDELLSFSLVERVNVTDEILISPTHSSTWELVPFDFGYPEVKSSTKVRSGSLDL